MDSLLGELQEIFRDVLDRGDLVVTPKSSASNIEEWDSLNHVVLISTIEKRYHVKFGLGALQDLKNVGDLLTLLESKLAAKV
jgi:acyl carrier protein